MVNPKHLRRFPPAKPFPALYNRRCESLRLFATRRHGKLHSRLIDYLLVNEALMVHARSDKNVAP
jgi:hypothetical protein